jgi:two-component system cell cycle sensor histidine kinase/response regulator CckA
MLKRLIGEYVDPSTVFEPGLWKVHTVPGQIEQIIMNLAVNARNAVPKGAKLTIETANVDLDEDYFRKHGIKEEQPCLYVMVACSNAGTGMDNETQSHIGSLK